MCILVFFGERQSRACHCEHVRMFMPGEVTAQQPSSFLIQLCVCIRVVWSGCMRDTVCTSLAKSCVADIQPARRQAGTQMSSRCLQYFITARHGWCPGPTQRAHSGVRTFTHRRPTSNPPNWPFPPLHYSALSEVIRGGAAALYLKPADCK